MTDLKPATGKAYFFLLTTALIWGGNAVAGKMAVGHASPFMLTLLRWIIALALIVAISVPQIRKDWPVIRKNGLYLFLMGCDWLYRLQRPALQRAALHERDQCRHRAGRHALRHLRRQLPDLPHAGDGRAGGRFMLTLCGIALTAANGDLGMLLSLQLNFGDLLMLFAVLVYAAYTVGLRFKPDLHWKSMMAATAAGAMVAAVPLGIYEWQSGAGQFPDAYGWASSPSLPSSPRSSRRSCSCAGWRSSARTGRVFSSTSCRSSACCCRSA